MTRIDFGYLKRVMAYKVSSMGARTHSAMWRYFAWKYRLRKKFFVLRCR